MRDEIKGLSHAEVLEKKSLGLSNEIIDSYNSTYPQIFIRNIFSLINIVLTPLLIALGYFELYKEIIAFSTFLIINTIVSIADEVRIKKKLDELKSEFQQNARVIREGTEHLIPVSEIVQGDFVKAREGEGIIADGTIVYENYFQVDESILTGESNYLRKENGEKVMSGSYVVTGECIYVVESIGKDNYLNRLGSEAVKVKEKKSPIQYAADKIILFLVISAILAGGLNLYFSVTNGATYEQAILSLTTIVALIIPQTLIFLFTLTFTISITKLYSKGILVQKGGSIEELSNVNVICFDKTGTITTNKMSVERIKYFNIKEETFGSFYNSIKSNLVGVNETQKLVNEKYKDFEKLEVQNFDQVPFTSKQKYSLVTAIDRSKRKIIALGAFSALSDLINEKYRHTVSEYLKIEESKGFRVLLGLYHEQSKASSFDIKDPLKFETDQIIVFTIEEELNPGIKDILNNLRDQNIAVKIISGDSKISVSRICQKVGIDVEQIVDLSENGNNLNGIDFEEAVLSKTVFTRAKPEDKLRIVDILKAHGLSVAMVGDGINDVLGLKAANVSIAMESGAKIARDVSDIVLLSNDYSKIPDIFYEGDNIIFNLKLSTKMFLVKSFFALLIAGFYTLQREIVPLHPASTLIFSFLGSSVPSYVLIFTRQKVNQTVSFFSDVLRSAIPTSIVFSLLFILLQRRLAFDYNFLETNTGLIIFVLAVSLIYSLYLVWEAGKLKNILLSIFVFVFVTAIGIFETILPIDLKDDFNINAVLIGLMIFAGFIFFLLLRQVIKPKKLKYKILITVLSFVWLPIAVIFPFRDYYSVTRIPIDAYLNISIFVLIGLIAIILINQIFRRIIK